MMIIRYGDLGDVLLPSIGASFSSLWHRTLKCMSITAKSSLLLKEYCAEKVSKIGGREQRVRRP